MSASKTRAAWCAWTTCAGQLDYDASYFSVVFKRELDMTAGESRAQAKTANSDGPKTNNGVTNDE
jgi:hypothetical protein